MAAVTAGDRSADDTLCYEMAVNSSSHTSRDVSHLCSYSAEEDCSSSPGSSEGAADGCRSMFRRIVVTADSYVESDATDAACVCYSVEAEDDMASTTAGYSESTSIGDLAGVDAEGAALLPRVAGGVASTSES